MESIKGHPEHVETVFGEAIIARDESLVVLSGACGLGPPDLCWLQKNSKSALTGATGEAKGYYHCCLGVDASSSAAVAAYFATLTSLVEPPTFLQGLFSTSEVRIERGFYCCYDPLTRLDVRCELCIPGGVVCGALDCEGNVHDVTPDLWRNCVVASFLRSELYDAELVSYSSIPVARYPPLPSPSDECRLLDAISGLYEDGVLPEALEALTVDQSGGVSPEHGDVVLHTLLHYLARRQRWGAALDFFARLSSTYPTAALYVAAVQRECGLYDEALSTLSRAVDEAPDDPLLLAGLATECLYAEQVEASLRFATRAARLRPLLRPAWLALARAHVRLGAGAAALVVVNLVPPPPLPGKEEAMLHVVVAPEPKSVTKPAVPSYDLDIASIRQVLVEESLAHPAEPPAASGGGAAPHTHLPAAPLLPREPPDAAQAPDTAPMRITRAVRAAVYTLLQELVAVSGWDGFLRLRSSVFVMHADSDTLREQQREAEEREQKLKLLHRQLSATLPPSPSWTQQQPPPPPLPLPLPLPPQQSAVDRRDPPEGLNYEAALDEAVMMGLAEYPEHLEDHYDDPRVVAAREAHRRHLREIAERQARLEAAEGGAYADDEWDESSPSHPGSDVGGGGGGGGGGGPRSASGRSRGRRGRKAQVRRAHQHGSAQAQGGEGWTDQQPEEDAEGEGSGGAPRVTVEEATGAAPEAEAVAGGGGNAGGSNGFPGGEAAIAVVDAKEVLSELQQEQQQAQEQQGREQQLQQQRQQLKSAPVLDGDSERVSSADGRQDATAPAPPSPGQAPAPAPPSPGQAPAPAAASSSLSWWGTLFGGGAGGDAGTQLRQRAAGPIGEAGEARDPCSLVRVLAHPLVQVPAGAGAAGADGASAGEAAHWLELVGAARQQQQRRRRQQQLVGALEDDDSLWWQPADRARLAASPLGDGSTGAVVCAPLPPLRTSQTWCDSILQRPAPQPPLHPGGTCSISGGVGGQACSEHKSTSVTVTSSARPLVASKGPASPPLAAALGAKGLLGSLVCKLRAGTAGHRWRRRLRRESLVALATTEHLVSGPSAALLTSASGRGCRVLARQGLLTSACTGSARKGSRGGGDGAQAAVAAATDRLAAVCRQAVGQHVCRTAGVGNGCRAGPVAEAAEGVGDGRGEGAAEVVVAAATAAARDPAALSGSVSGGGDPDAVAHVGASAAGPSAAGQGRGEGEQGEEDEEDRYPLVLQSLDADRQMVLEGLDVTESGAKRLCARWLDELIVSLWLDLQAFLDWKALDSELADAGFRTHAEILAGLAPGPTPADYQRATQPSPPLSPGAAAASAAEGGGAATPPPPPMLPSVSSLEWLRRGLLAERLHHETDALAAYQAAVVTPPPPPGGGGSGSVLAAVPGAGPGAFSMIAWQAIMRLAPASDPRDTSWALRAAQTVMSWLEARAPSSATAVPFTSGFMMVPGSAAAAAAGAAPGGARSAPAAAAGAASGGGGKLNACPLSVVHCLHLVAAVLGDAGVEATLQGQQSAGGAAAAAVGTPQRSGASGQALGTAKAAGAVGGGAATAAGPVAVHPAAAGVLRYAVQSSAAAAARAAALATAAAPPGPAGTAAPALALAR